MARTWCWKILLRAVVVASIALSLVQGQGLDDEYKHLYDRHMFEEAIKAAPHFIMFFAPWCGHCKKAMPVFDELADKYNLQMDPRPPLYLAKVDCTKEIALCDEHGATGYPTFKMYRPGQEVERYKGDRTAKAFEDYFTQMTAEVAKPVPPEPKHGLYSLEASNFQDHVAKGLHFIKFYAPWCGHCKRLAPTWDELATTFEHEEHLTIAKVDCTLYNSVCQDYDVRGYPTLLLFRDGDMLEKYSGGRGHAELKTYVSSKLEESNRLWEKEASKPKETVKIQKSGEGPKEPQGEVPAEPESKVQALDSDTFNAEVSKGITFVKFYAPWCGHCKRMAPTWDALSHKFPDQPHVKIAKVDCTTAGNKELCQDHKIRGYPTLILFRSEAGKQEQYSGPRDLSALHSFVRRALHDEL
ncbi:thioredoxin domain-containing protein 5-like isoform X2 [Branchiostoma floridae x Branchiostoma belcheri]